MTTTTDYFSDVSKTELMRIVVSLATEVYETKDRLTALESILDNHNIDLTALDAPTEPAVYDDKRKEARDNFIQNVFSSLSR